MDLGAVVGDVVDLQLLQDPVVRREHHVLQLPDQKVRKDGDKWDQDDDQPVPRSRHHDGQEELVHVLADRRVKGPVHNQEQEPNQDGSHPSLAEDASL